jgi:hypothetical protein
MEANTITAIRALVVSTAATTMAAWSASQQRRHTRLSVQPIAAIPIADFEGRVGVFLANNGLGPMRIKKILVIGDRGIIHNNIVSHMPPLPNRVLWTNFYDTADGIAIPHGKRIELLLLEGNCQDDVYREAQQNTRKSLANLTVRVEYYDLYGQEMDPVEEHLSFFGRHFAA